MSEHDFGTDVDKLAEKIATKALNSEDEDFLLEAFKLLGPYYINRRKLDGKNGGKENGASFDAMRQRIEEDEE